MCSLLLSEKIHVYVYEVIAIVCPYHLETSKRDGSSIL